MSNVTTTGDYLVERITTLLGLEPAHGGSNTTLWEAHWHNPSGDGVDDGAALYVYNEGEGRGDTVTLHGTRGEDEEYEFTQRVNLESLAADATGVGRSGYDTVNDVLAHVADTAVAVMRAYGFPEAGA